VSKEIVYVTPVAPGALVDWDTVGCEIWCAATTV
jgi:hypothetical protein